MLLLLKSIALSGLQEHAFIPVVYNLGMTNFSQLVQDLKQQRDQIDKAIAALDLLTSNSADRNSDSPVVTSRGRRRRSAAARARMAAAQRARWARMTGRTTGGNGRAGKQTPTRTISAAGRRRIAAAQRARWAKLKARR